MRRIPVTSAQQLGAAARAAREKSNITLAVAAASIGVSVKFLQAFEVGKTTVRFDKALTVAAHFGIALVAEVSE
jgi:predicted transcriptional regulator